MGSDADQVHSFHFNSCEGDWDRVDWLPVELPNRGHTENFTIRIEELNANTIGNVELFTSGLSPVNLSVPVDPPAGFTVNLVPAATNVWTITIPCGLLQNTSERLYVRVTKANNNNFGTYRVTSSVLSEPKLTLASDESKCTNESFEVSVVDLPTGTSVNWTASVELGNGILPLVPASVNILSNGRASITSSVEGRIFITATISNILGCEQSVFLNSWIGKIPTINLQINHSEVEPDQTCPNTLLRLSANLLEENGIDWEQVEEVQWTSSSPYFPIINNTGRAIQIRTSRQEFDYTTVTLRIKNACGWTEVSQNFRISDNTTHCIPHHGRIDMQTYPNPTKSDIKVIFKVECQDCTSEELENLYPKIDESTVVILNDAFGNTRLQYIGKQIPLDINKNIHLNLTSLPIGNYVLKVITKEEVFFVHVIKE